MWDQQVLYAEAEVSESVDRYLGVIELALETGDIDAAQRHLRLVRLALLDGPDPQEPGAMVGGVALTGQEIASLRLLPDGSLSQKDIARTMGVTRNTLKTHLKSLYLKLGVHCRAEAINRARQIGLLPRPLTLVAASARSNDDAAICA